MATAQGTRHPQNFKDLTGQKFGRLTVITRAGTRGAYALWRCSCECGRESFVASASLRSGHTQSCGCLLREAISRARTHGCARYKRATPEYGTWRRAISRTERQCVHRFDRYGGRGIKMCQRWRKSFEAFIADMGHKPTAKHSLDRIDNNRGYWCGKAECPECGPLGREPNCQWATKTEQMRNRISNHLLTFNGRTQTLTAWAEETGIGGPTIRYRLRAKWSVEAALTTPVRNKLS